MELELWNATLSKRAQLLKWMKGKGYFRTSDVDSWGVQNYYTSAMREARKFDELGYIRRLSEEEKIFRGFKVREGVYEYLGEHWNA